MKRNMKPSNKNKKKVVVVVVVSGVVSSVGRLGETWVGWPDLCRPIFQVLYTATIKHLLSRTYYSLLDTARIEVLELV